MVTPSSLRSRADPSRSLRPLHRGVVVMDSRATRGAATVLSRSASGLADDQKDSTDASALRTGESFRSARSARVDTPFPVRRVRVAARCSGGGGDDDDVLGRAGAELLQRGRGLQSRRGAGRRPAVGPTVLGDRTHRPRRRAAGAERHQEERAATATANWPAGEHAAKLRRQFTVVRCLPRTVDPHPRPPLGVQRPD